MSPALEGGFLTTGSPGKSWTSFFLSFPIQSLPLIQFRKTCLFSETGSLLSSLSFVFRGPWQTPPVRNKSGHFGEIQTKTRGIRIFLLSCTCWCRKVHGASLYPVWRNLVVMTPASEFAWSSMATWTLVWVAFRKKCFICTVSGVTVYDLHIGSMQVQMFCLFLFLLEHWRYHSTVLWFPLLFLRSQMLV